MTFGGLGAFRKTHGELWQVPLAFRKGMTWFFASRSLWIFRWCNAQWKLLMSNDVLPFRYTIMPLFAECSMFARSSPSVPPSGATTSHGCSLVKQGIWALSMTESMVVPLSSLWAPNASSWVSILKEFWIDGLDFIIVASLGGTQFR